MLENLPDIEQTRFFQDVVKIGEKRGVKIGKQSFIIEEIERYKKLNESGELPKNIYKILCEPLHKELKRFKKELTNNK